jgi:MFS family permease
MSFARKLPFHYAWLVVGLTFLVLLLTAGVRTLPSVMIVPLEAEFGWDRASISFAVAVSLFAFGFGGPISGTLIDRFGIRRVMVGGMALTALGLFPLVGLRDLWQLHLLWGLIVGIGTGGIANVLSATVAARWFNRYRGLVLGLLGAATAMGQLIFIPAMIAISSTAGWRVAVSVVAIILSAALIPVLLFMRDRPRDVGLEMIGGDPVSAAGADDKPTGLTLRQALRTRDFWLLAGSFFVCGYTTNGLIGTHLLPHTVEHGFVEVESAAAISVMGLMNIFGTLASGWFSDRFDNRKLLATYYGLRGLSLLALPFIVEGRGLFLFAVVYGLDWVATVPPTVNLTAQRFGRANFGAIYGWIFCAHMIGAGIAAQAGGLFRDWLGDYHLIFLTAAVMGLIASGLVVRISIRGTRSAVQSAAAAT